MAPINARIVRRSLALDGHLPCTYEEGIRRGFSEASRRSQNEYSRFFNRRHKRDGTLVRGRFFSRPVTSLTYRSTLVRYIDNNAVKAGLARTPWSYRWGSPAHDVFASGPQWLERSWVESEAKAEHQARFHGEDYVRTFGEPFEEATHHLVESLISSTRLARDELDDLVGRAPSHVRAWMKRKATLADGVRIGLPVCDTESIQYAIQKTRDENGEWDVSPNRHKRCAYGLIEVALLRTMAGRTWEQISAVIGSALSPCQRRLEVHHRLLKEDPAYAQKACADQSCRPRGRPSSLSAQLRRVESGRSGATRYGPSDQKY